MGRLVGALVDALDSGDVLLESVVDGVADIAVIELLVLEESLAEVSAR